MTNRSPDNQLPFVIFHWSFAKSLSAVGFWVADGLLRVHLCSSVFICGFVHTSQVFHGIAEGDFRRPGRKTQFRLCARVVEIPKTIGHLNSRVVEREMSSEPRIKSPQHARPAPGPSLGNRKPRSANA